MIDDIIQQVATQTRRQFPMVERDDIVQELWLWTLEHQRKTDDWLAGGQDGVRQLAKSLARAGRAYAIKEKAAVVGYDVEDLYFYSTGQLRELLPIVLDRALWTEAGTPSDLGIITGTTDPALGNNRLAMLCDVRASLEAGRPADKELLWTAFGLALPDEEHAEQLGITVEALRTRVMRAVQRLQKALGGPKPDGLYQGTRRAMTNAQSLALTRNQEAEE